MYCNVCNKYRKFKNTEISYVFKKLLSLPIVYSTCSHEYKKVFKILGLNNNIEEYQKIYNHV